MSTAIDRSVLSLPRAQWAQHPHYPSQVLLLGGHKTFRHLSRVLLRRAETGGDIPGIGWVFAQWKSAMGSHEGYEEHKLYPYLEARWGLSCAALQAGHTALHACDQAVRDALRDADRGALVAALREHDRVLLDHLDDEEALVIPALLALSPGEFDTYARSDIRTLLAGLVRH